jgi:hypothetical protein
MAGPQRGGGRPRRGRSPVRLLGAIGEGGGCVVLAGTWRSSRATTIGLEFNGEGREGLTRAEEGHGGAGSIELGEGKREWPRPVWRKRELGRSFYRRSGRGREREVASTGELSTTGMVAHSGDDGTTRAGGDGMARLAQGDRDARHQLGWRAS